MMESLPCWYIAAAVFRQGKNRVSGIDFPVLGIDAQSPDSSTVLGPLTTEASEVLSGTKSRTGSMIKVRLNLPVSSCIFLYLPESSWIFLNL